MKEQVFNPYLPLWEYIPDGEPHVFGDRLYIFGSHDRFNSDKYCENDYTCWSAPVEDLSDWTNHGVIYRRLQDPISEGRDRGARELWAPDVCVGPDGRYYMYYCIAWATCISVAVSDRPEGPYEYYGVIRRPDGSTYGDGEDEMPFDPGVLRDEDGRLWLYTAFGATDPWLVNFLKDITPLHITGKCNYVMELDPGDMVTIRSHKPCLPGKSAEDPGSFKGHEFYEASSIRKFNGRYYTIYSSVNGRELCWAVSDRPDGGFVYGGILHDNGGVTPDCPKGDYYPGNNHGSVEYVNGKYYVFGHRQTNYNEFSRQGVAEEIKMDDHGRFIQAEWTSCGLNGGPLCCGETYPASICSALYIGEGYTQMTATSDHPQDFPMITQELEDGVRQESQYICNILEGSVIGWKYFDFKDVKSLTLSVRGKGEGVFNVYQAVPGKTEAAASIPVSGTAEWQDVTAAVPFSDGVHPLYLAFHGEGRFDLKSFAL